MNKEKRQNNPLSSDHFWLPQWQFYTRCKSIVVNASVIFYSSSLSQVFLRCSIHPSRISYLSTKYSKIELSQAKVVVFVFLELLGQHLVTLENQISTGPLCNWSVNLLIPVVFHQWTLPNSLRMWSVFTYFSWHKNTKKLVNERSQLPVFVLVGGPLFSPASSSRNGTDQPSSLPWTPAL